MMCIHSYCRKESKKTTPKKIKDEKVDGETLQDLSENDLKEIGVKLGTRKKIMRIIKHLKTLESTHTFDGNSEVQEYQILPGEPMSNSMVFDLIASGTSCTVLPDVSTSRALALPAPQTFPSTTQIRPREPRITRMSSPGPSFSSSGTPNSSQSSSITLEEVLPTHVSPPSSENSTPPATKTPFLRFGKRKSATSTVNISLSDSPGPPKNTYYDSESVDVQGMLEKYASGKRILRSLKTGEGISRSEVSEIVRIVVHTMVEDIQSLYPTSEQKYNLAKAIVRDIPELKSNREGVEGCEQFYDRTSNSGSVEWRLKTMRVSLPNLRKKRKSMKPHPPSTEGNYNPEEEITYDDDVIEKISWLKLQPPVESNKSAIIEAMNDTFDVRRNFITRSFPTISEILDEYPKLKDFDGVLIDKEFKRLFPNAENLLERLPEYSEKVKIYVSQKRHDIGDRMKHVSDENLKTLMCIADLLPLPGMKKRRSENERLCHSSESLLIFAGAQSALNQQEPYQHPVLMCSGEIYDEELQYFLILDREYIDVGKCFVKAFDILYKSHYVFNVEYPKNLVGFYNFMDHIIYKVSTGSARSSVEHLNNVLCTIK